MVKKIVCDELDRVINADRIFSLINEFGEIGKDSNGGVSRLAFSKEDIIARRKIIKIMEKELFLETRIDPWGNIIGKRKGKRNNVPSIMTGSHLDSVKNGGMFDGPAGVIGGVEVIRVFNQLGVETNHPIELVVFVAEEPNDFGVSTLGSRGMCGKLRKEDLIGIENTEGVPLLEAIKGVGGDPERFEEGVRKKGDIKSFVEIHIEQMPYLEREKKDIGIVEGITGICRLQVEIKGSPKHSGTTPMRERKDALVGASYLVQALYDIALSMEGVVATVGKIFSEPNAINIIPGKVTLEMEIRSYDEVLIEKVLHKFQGKIDLLRRKYRVLVALEKTYETAPTPFSEEVRKKIGEACRFFNFSTLELISMAGHDAGHMAGITETGMIFLPSRKGLSHCPEEWTDPIFLAKGTKVLAQTLLLIDQNV